MTQAVSDRTVLVTGGAGFIGSHLVAALAPDNDVRVLDDFSAGSRLRLPTDVTVIEGDVRDDDALGAAMRDVDVVFHLAAVVSVEESVCKPRHCQETNAAATLSVLDHARLEDARVVVASSAAVYGPPASLPLAESAPTHPQSPYGISKLAADLYARRFAALYDLPAVPLRYFNVYGPRRRDRDPRGVIDVFVDQARDGGPITVEGDGQQTRDFVHVADVVDATLRAGVTDATGVAFNVGTGTAVSIRELAERVRRVIDADVDITHVGKRSGDVRDSRADLTRTRERLDFEPSVDLADGLRSVADRESLRPG
jgi:UDP-glucose 4-epimerase